MRIRHIAGVHADGKAMAAARMPGVLSASLIIEYCTVTSVQPCVTGRLVDVSHDAVT